MQKWNSRDFHTVADANRREREAVDPVFLVLADLYTDRVSCRSEQVCNVARHKEFAIQLLDLFECHRLHLLDALSLPGEGQKQKQVWI